jgi:hypothetical protein
MPPKVNPEVKDYLAKIKQADYWTEAGDAQVLISDTANGPEEVGLAAAGSDLISSDARLNIYPSLVHTVGRLAVPAGCSEEMARLYRTAAVVVTKHVLFVCLLISLSGESRRYLTTYYTDLVFGNSWTIKRSCNTFGLG